MNMNIVKCLLVCIPLNLIILWSSNTIINEGLFNFKGMMMWFIGNFLGISTAILIDILTRKGE